MARRKAKRRPAQNGHFPKRGERKIDGVWKSAEELAALSVGVAAVVVSRPVETAADRRNYLRRQAGWPALRS